MLDYSKNFGGSVIELVRLPTPSSQEIIKTLRSENLVLIREKALLRREIERLGEHNMELIRIRGWLIGFSIVALTAVVTILIIK